MKLQGCLCLPLGGRGKTMCFGCFGLPQAQLEQQGEGTVPQGGVPTNKPGTSGRPGPHTHFCLLPREGSDTAG